MRLTHFVGASHRQCTNQLDPHHQESNYERKFNTFHTLALKTLSSLKHPSNFRVSFSISTTKSKYK
jgi:hypothetical protein